MSLDVLLTSERPIPLEVEFSVQPGEILALAGPSGAGKSTVLRAIAGLWTPPQGRVQVAGHTWLDTASGVNFPAHHRKIGAVFQSYALFPQMSAQKNIEAGGASAQEAQRLLGLFGLSDLKDRRPHALSGGQQQRVALARALARHPDVLLLDEPFSAVDRPTREGLYQAVLNLRAELDMPVVLVTHDMEEARRLADRVVVLDKGQVLRTGSTAEVLFDPSVLRGMGLRGAGSTLTARIAEQEADGLTRLDCPAGPLFLPRIDGMIGHPVRVRIMAHDVILSLDAPAGLSALNTLPCVIDKITEGDGPGAMVHLRVGEDVLLARVTQRSVHAMELTVGQTCYAIVKSMAVARHQIGRSG